MVCLRKYLGTLAATASAVGLMASSAFAETKTLRLHSFNSPKSVETDFIFVPLQKDVEMNSNGSLKIQIYFGMSLGGKASDLIPQVVNGVVDMVYTLPAYHAGRFPILTAVELPFLGEGGEVFSQVAWDWYEKHAHREFEDFKLITLNAIDPGMVHTSKTPVRKLEDMQGLKIRVAGRYIGMAVDALGAVPVQMPLTDVYESLARGQVQGMMIPWLITVPFKFADVTKYHTDIPIYHSLLLTVMNKQSYNKLSEEQKAGIEKSIGRDYGRRYGKLWDDGAEKGRAIAKEKGNEIIKLSPEEERRWRDAADAASEAWIKDMDSKGLDGRGMFNDLLEIVKKYQT